MAPSEGRRSPIPGPPPKDPKIRQRTNKKSTAAELVGQFVDSKPPLPSQRPDNQKKWHAMTLEWWSKVWAAPMAREFLESDVQTLLRLAILIDNFWLEPKAGLAAEIRLQEMRFGLTPLDRWRLQWEVRRVFHEEKPDEKPSRQRASGSGKDPRGVLRVVK